MSGEGADQQAELSLKKGDRSPGINVVVEKVIATKDEMGGVMPKSKFEATARMRRLGLVVKEALVWTRSLFGKEKQSMSLAQRYYERWRFLRKVGIPTASSMRIVNDEQIAMGDMTRDGSVFFGKSYEGYLYDQIKEGSKRELTDMEKVFLKIPLEPIREEMNRIATIAVRNGIELPGDDPCDFLVHPDGSWEILVLDLAELKLNDDIDVETTVNEMDYWIARTRYDLLKVQK